MNCDRFDSIQLLSVSDFIEIYYQMLRNAMDTTASEAAKNKTGFDGNLLENDAKDLLEYSERNQMPLVSQALAEVLTCLERNNEKKTPEVRETAIYNTLLRLEKAVEGTSTWELCEEDFKGSLIDLTSFEVNMIEQQMSLYIADLLDKNGSSKTLFFPLTDFYSSDVIVKWRILEKIATITLLAEETVYKQKLKIHLRERLKSEVNDWLQREIEKLKLTGNNTILKDAVVMSKLLRDLRSQVTTAIDVIMSQTLFDESGCSYFDVLSETVDEMLFPVCEQVMQVMDIYQARHRDFLVNMRDSCALSHSLYLQLKKLVNLLIAQVKTERHLKLQGYMNIFSKFFANLLQVMKLECHNRIKRAVQAEMKDSVHSEEQILSSSVIVLNCMCTVIDEWKHMEIEDAEQKLAFLVKITDIFCDGAKIFAECLENRTESMAFPLKDTEALKKVSVLANSIEHVFQYMQELPHQMQWSQVLECLGRESSDATLKEQVLRILDLIHQSMNAHVSEIVTKLLNVVASGVHDSMEKVFLTWLQSRGTNQAFDRFLGHLNDVLGNLHETLKEHLFSKFLSHLWPVLITCIQKNFEEGQPPEYAKTLKDNIFSLKDYFLQDDMTDLEVHQPLLQQIMDLLELNSKSTEELQLDYYVQIAESIVSPVEYLGHIAFQAGYKTLGDECVDLYINVQKGQRLPARKFEMSHLVVKVELCPGSLFPSQVPFKSSPVIEDLDNPVFNEFFQFFGLPPSILNIKGAVVQVLVLNQDYSFSAEAILLLNQVQNMSGILSLEFLPVYLMPLRKFDMSHICYQVLENRSRWDKNAKSFVNKRAKLSKGQKTLLSCIPGNIMCNFARND